MIILIIYCLLFFISLIINIYISIVEKGYKNKKNKKEFTGCELSHEILDLYSNNNSYILLTKGDSLYNSLRDTIKLDEYSFDESSLYAIAVSALKSYEAIDKKNSSVYKNRDKLSKLVFYMVVLSYIMIIMGTLLNEFTFSVIGIALITVVTLYDLYLINVYKNNIPKIVKNLSSNGLIDKDEKTDIKKCMEVESLRSLTRLISVINTLLDALIPYE